jgi:hypothetical protein
MSDNVIQGNSNGIWTPQVGDLVTHMHVDSSIIKLFYSQYEGRLITAALNEKSPAVAEVVAAPSAMNQEMVEVRYGDLDELGSMYVDVYIQYIRPATMYELPEFRDYA